MKPDANQHNPDPAYLRDLIKRAGLTQNRAADQIGISTRAIRYYVSGQRTAPYPVQFALEALAASRHPQTSG